MHRYTDEQKMYIKQIAPGRYNSEIVELFNQKFETTLTEGQIKSFKTNHKIKSHLQNKRKTPVPRLFTDEQTTFIKQHVKGQLNKELADLVNETFHLSITAKQINIWKKNHGLISGLDTKFKRGDEPANKGTKGVYNVGGNVTSFKKGHKPSNYKPVGYERIDREGYILVKVTDDGPWPKRWRPKHKVIWEEKNGLVPKGHVLIFGDGNKNNITLDNLILITREQLAIMNRNGFIQKDIESTKTGIIMADILHKIGQRKKGEEKC